MEALTAYIQQREQGQHSPYTPEQRIQALQQAIEALRKDIHEPDTAAMDDVEGYRRNDPLEMDEIMGLFAELRAGFSEQDLEELEWAINTD